MVKLDPDTISTMCVARYRYIHFMETDTETNDKFGSADLDRQD